MIQCIKYCVAALVFIQATSAIQNGTTAQTSEFPYLVSLKSKNIHICAASILNKNFVLTTANCIDYVNDEFDQSNFTIQWGQQSLTEDNENTIEVEEVCVPFGWNDETREFNFAVLKLRTSLPDSFHWQQVKLPWEDVAISENTPALSANWGAEKTYEDNTNILRKVNVNIYKDDTCTDALPWEYCVTAEDGSFCKGDSGAPLVNSDNIQIGIGAYLGLLTCEKSNWPVTFVRIGQYVNHIQQLINAPYWTFDKCKPY